MSLDGLYAKLFRLQFAGSGKNGNGKKKGETDETH